MFRRVFPCVLLALIVPACGPENVGYQLPVHPTGGTITRHGEPVRGAIVRFHPEEPATIRLPEGETGPPIVLTTETDDAGAFTLSTYFADDGVPAGDYVVTVATISPETNLENADDRPRAKATKRPASEKQYLDAASSPFHASVRPDQSNRFEFELK